MRQPLRKLAPGLEAKSKPAPAKRTPGRPELETLAQAEARNLKRMVDRVPDIAAALEACDRQARCGLVSCAVCARNFKFPLIRESLGIGKSQSGQREIATIFLAEFPAGKLAQTDVKRRTSGSASAPGLPRVLPSAPDVVVAESEPGKRKETEKVARNSSGGKDASSPRARLPTSAYARDPPQEN